MVKILQVRVQELPDVQAGYRKGRGTRDQIANIQFDSWEICIQVREQQLELDMKKQTGSKSEKEYIKGVYCYLLI